MPDRLESLLARFSVGARAFQLGNLCGVNELPAAETGQLHVIWNGEVDVWHAGAVAERIRSPSLLLYARPMAHRFVVQSPQGAHLTCAHLHFERGVAHPIAQALPAYLCLALTEIPEATGVLELLFQEASEQRCGRHAVLDRLFEVVLIQVLRHLMEREQTDTGLMAGMAHPQVRRALVAMHEHPERDWSLDTLAHQAGMSRSQFANAFRDTVGATPGAYLQQWRVALAQQGLRRGRPLKHIVDEVGYGSEAALSRAFKAQTGLSPRAWKTQQADLAMPMSSL